MPPETQAETQKSPESTNVWEGEVFPSIIIQMIKRFTWTCSVLVSGWCAGLFDRSVYISGWSHVAFCCLRVKSFLCPCSCLDTTHTWVRTAIHTHNPPTCVQLRAWISKNKNDYQKPQLLLEAFQKRRWAAVGPLHLVPDHPGVKARDLMCTEVCPTAGQVKAQHTQHGCSRARSLSRGRSHWEICDYSVNNRKRIVFSNCSRTILSIWKSHAEPDVHVFTPSTFKNVKLYQETLTLWCLCGSEGNIWDY